MSPLIRSFPDMKAIVGFSFPETARREKRRRYPSPLTSNVILSVTVATAHLRTSC